MQTRPKLIAVSVLALAAAAGTSAVIAAAPGADKEVPITGTALERASAAALAHTGQGRVTETEAGDEDGAYEVEVTLDDGAQVDVHLNESFTVISTKADKESGTETDGP